jgi:enoyl-CoA hydratase/carnithine racemase
MHTEYRWLLAQADQDPAVRVIVVTGDPEGQAFCAGADLGALEGHSEKGKYDPGTDDSIAMPGFGVDPAFDASFAYHFGIGKPVIAAINGAAAGVGLVLCAFADLRFCATGAKFTAAHGRFNFPAEFGLSWVLPRIVGLTHANDILLSSRVFTAEEALAMGFLNRLVAPEALMDEVMTYARTLAANVAPAGLSRPAPGRGDLGPGGRAAAGGDDPGAGLQGRRQGLDGEAAGRLDRLTPVTPRRCAHPIDNFSEAGLRLFPQPWRPA